MALMKGLSRDFLGSDVFVDYQRTYVWQANQVGHIAIGFVPASALSWIFRSTGSSDFWFYVACAVVVALYAAKEFADLVVAKRQAQGWLDLHLGELWRDMATDTWFVTSGVAMAAAAHVMHYYGLIAFVVSVAAFFVLRSVFLPAKKSLDRAGLPYMFRLCNFPQSSGFKAHNGSRIRAFIENREIDCYTPSPAILIQGYRATGKSTLAIAIGTEVALHKTNGRYGRARYLTAFALFERDAREGNGKASQLERRMSRFFGAGDPWKLDCADVLIIDDVDSDNGVYGSLKTQQILDKLKEQPDLCKLLRSKRTVWVTGTSQFNDDCAERGWTAWHKALCTFYGCEIQDTGCSDIPTAIVAREPIPVIWLQQPLVEEAS